MRLATPQLPALPSVFARNGHGATPTIASETIVERLERLTFLDPISGLAQKAVRALVPQESRAKSLLSGTWLGHPVHPPLTDVVVGSWLCAWFLDVAGGERSQPAADRLIGLGIAASVPTALSGLSDWAELGGGNRRVGTVHAVGNTTALVLHALSWRARRRRGREHALTLSTLGLASASLSAWLGGHLSYARGVGVNQTAFDELPADWTAVTDESGLAEGRLVQAPANGVNVLLVRQHGELHAMHDRCSHRGCSLSEGKLGDGTITCGCHASMFRLDGSLVRGPATSPQPSLEVRLRDGSVEVRRRGDA
jgi:nitrite reductase/ring-hydroxylating ferredoxin subunit/uncharacterized membrane protein